MFTTGGELDKKEVERTDISISFAVRWLERWSSCIKFSKKRLKKGEGLWFEAD